MEKVRTEWFERIAPTDLFRRNFFRCVQSATFGETVKRKNS